MGKAGTFGLIGLVFGFIAGMFVFLGPEGILGMIVSPICLGSKGWCPLTSFFTSPIFYGSIGFFLGSILDSK